jgi:hypothetical protein
MDLQLTNAVKKIAFDVLKSPTTSEYGEVALNIRDLTDESFGKYWACIVSEEKAMGSYVWNEANSYILF